MTFKIGTLICLYLVCRKQFASSYYTELTFSIFGQLSQTYGLTESKSHRYFTLSKGIATVLSGRCNPNTKKNKCVVLEYI